MKANETIPAKGKCFCPLAKADEQLQEKQADQEVGTPGPDEVTAADLQDEDQQHPRVPTPLPEVPLPQVEEEIPVDRREEVAPPTITSDRANIAETRNGLEGRAWPGITW